MIDGLKQEQFLVGSTYSDYVSGINIANSTQTLTTSAATTVNATTGSFVTANITTGNVVTLVATNLKSGSNALSSGSRWVTFATAFSSANYHTAVTHLDCTDGGVELIGIGSKSAGSFLAMGSASASTAVFDWVAIPRQT